MNLLSLGKIEVDVIDQPILLNEVAQWNPNLTHGAGSIFFGYVRSINVGRKVIGIDYECFKPLCLKVFKEIAIEAQAKWHQEANILVIHRQGHLKVSEASVAIAVTTKHRDESFKISRYVIEEIKTRAPIWKKEYYVDGESEWVQGHALCQHRKDDQIEKSNCDSSSGW